MHVQLLSAALPSIHSTPSTYLFISHLHAKRKEQRELFNGILFIFKISLQEKDLN